MIARRLRIDRLQLAFILLMLATPSIAGQKELWDRHSLPKPIASRIHVQASEVPPFPHTEAWLADPHQWPESLTIAGRTGFRDASGLVHDVIVHYGRSLAKVPPGHPVDQSYEIQFPRVEGQPPQSEAIGPRFNWDWRGRVVRRIWYAPADSGRYASYIYHPTGQLKSYSNYGAVTRDSMTAFNEFFDREGGLLCASYEQKIGGKEKAWYCWMGKTLTREEFGRNIGNWFHKEATLDQ